VQVHAVRLLIAEHQLAQTRATVHNANEPVLIADAQGRVLFGNPAFAQLVGAAAAELASLDDLAALFVPPEPLRHMLADLRHAHQPWRGEVVLAAGNAAAVPVGLRAEAVQGRDGTLLGFMLLFADRRESRRTEAARAHLERSLSAVAEAPRGPRDTDALLGAILTHASVAAMDIADATGAPRVAAQIEELELSTQRASQLCEQIRGLLPQG